MAELFDKLVRLSESDYYPFHMPGHKRNREGHPLEKMFLTDITEIDGFDNLHHASGIIKKMQGEAAKIYSTKETFFLVNGSTGGILAAVSASVKKDGKLLMARNCHKAVYNACLVRKVDAEYVYPKFTDHPYIYGDIAPEDIEDALKQHENIDAVIITSPNYDGVVSDIERIADIVHEHHAILIVDEAHGAHFKYSELFPKSAVECGADIVIQSLHKTLPSLTQTALLHVCSDRVDLERLKIFLTIYQTSSPSYVFMSTMQQCIEDTEANKAEWFGELDRQLDKFREDTANLRNLEVLSTAWAKQNGLFDFDKSKIIVSTIKCSLNGEQLYEILLKQYHLQMEMSSAGYVLAIASVGDKAEGFLRLAKALLEIDAALDKNAEPQRIPDKGFIRKNEKVLPMYEAFETETESLLIEEAKDCISGEFVYLYPPGIPMLVPGELITEKFAEAFVQCREMGLPLQGTQDYKLKYIKVRKE